MQCSILTTNLPRFTLTLQPLFSFFSSSLAFHFARAPMQSPHEFALKGQRGRVKGR